MNYDGRWIQEAIAKSCGLDRKADEKSIGRIVYKWTTCGAWVRFDEHGVIVGTIVEGSDAEFSERIELDGLDDMDQKEAEKELCERFWDALERMEQDAEYEWECVHDDGYEYR